MSTSNSNAMILALDFGGTKHTAGVISVPGSGIPDDPSVPTWRAYRQVFSPPGADAAYDLSTLVDLGGSLLAGERPAAVGVSFGGPVDFDAGRVLLSHHVPGWENFPLRQQLEDAFDAPALVDNDANVAALGEHRYGAGRGFRHLMYITVSTGVGGGWILNGRVWHGEGSLAGEIGHIPVDPNGPRCLCGKKGCVERLASGPYLAQDAREILAQDDRRGPIIRKLAQGDPESISAKLISQAAGQDDELAEQLLQRSAWAVGVGIGSAANLINPQCFILGGGVTKAGSPWWSTLRQVAQATALPQVNFEVLPAALGDDAPLWGAVALAQDCLAQE